MIAFIFCFVFFFNDTATTEIYTLSLHDALPILVLLDLGLPRKDGLEVLRSMRARKELTPVLIATARDAVEQRIRSEEHTSELQSQFHLVCRLLLEKKKKKNERHIHRTPENNIYS